MKDEIYIVCTGPSALDFDFDQLKGKDVLSVNYAYRDVPNMMGCVALDVEFIRKNFRELKEKDIHIYWVQGYNKDEDFRPLLRNTPYYATGISGIDYKPMMCRHAFNSGYTALHIAVNMGYKKIHLIGMDINTEGHYYADDNNGPGYDHLNVYLEDFENDLKKDIIIINYSPHNQHFKKNENTIPHTRLSAST